jgi:hypothetical protein
VDSQIERKHNTWRASPVATAMQALITDPSWPDISTPPVNQSSSSRNAS